MARKKNLSERLSKRMGVLEMKYLKVFESLGFFRVFCVTIFIGTMFHPSKISHISRLETLETFEDVFAIGEEFEPGTKEWREKILEVRSPVLKI